MTKKIRASGNIIKVIKRTRGYSTVGNNYMRIGAPPRPPASGPAVQPSSILRRPLLDRQMVIKTETKVINLFATGLHNNDFYSDKSFQNVKSCRKYESAAEI